MAIASAGCGLAQAKATAAPAEAMGRNPGARCHPLRPAAGPRADRIAGTLRVGHHLYQGEVVSISAGIQILCSAAAVSLACTCEQPAGAQIRRLRSLQLN